MDRTSLAIHLWLAYSGYAAFFVACVSALAYLLQERSLKQKRPQVLLASMWSLETFDKVNLWAVIVGFALFTCSVGIGQYLAVKEWGVAWDPKSWWAAVTWSVYAALVAVRVTSLLRGRRVAMLSVLGFLCVLFLSHGVEVVFRSRHVLVQSGG